MNRWWYVSKGEKKGSVSEGQLYHLLRAGTITAQSPLRKAGMKDWQPAARIDELVPLLKSLPLPPAQQYSPAGAWHRMRRHLGSSIVLGLGCLGVIAGLPSVALAVDIPHVATFTGHTLIAGAVMILGALAYRSAKKRKYGEGKATLTRQLLEFALLVPIFVVIFAVILSPIGFAYLAETNPVPNLVISIGAIAAYLVSGFMPPVFTQRRDRRPVVAKEKRGASRSHRSGTAP